MTDKSKPFVIEQLEEALEERQNPDRRKRDVGPQGDAQTDRRKGDRRTEKDSAAK